MWPHYWEYQWTREKHMVLTACKDLSRERRGPNMNVSPALLSGIWWVTTPACSLTDAHHPSLITWPHNTLLFLAQSQREHSSEMLVPPVRLHDVTTKNTSVYQTVGIRGFTLACKLTDSILSNFCKHSANIRKLLCWNMINFINKCIPTIHYSSNHKFTWTSEPILITLWRLL